MDLYVINLGWLYIYIYIYIYLIRRRLIVYYRWVFLRAVPYFDEPVRRVKIQTTIKNSQRYYTTRRLIRDLLSNTPNCYVIAREFSRHLVTENAWQKYARRNEIGAGNPANWLVNNRKTTQTGFCGFDQAIIGEIYFTFHKGKNIVFRLSKLHIQVFHFKTLSRKNVEKKFVLTNNFFRNLNPIRLLRVPRQPN